MNRTAVYRVIVLASFVSLATTHVTFAQVSDAALSASHPAGPPPPGPSATVRSTVLPVASGPGHLTAAPVTDASLSTSPAAVAGARDPSQVPRPPLHKFFDAANITLTVAESAALIADGVYTQRGLNRYPDRGYEADPLARPFVNAGWPGQIAGGVLVVGADVALRYVLHRKGHHTLERLVPFALIVYGTAGAVHNARVLRDIERGR